MLDNKRLVDIIRLADSRRCSALMAEYSCCGDVNICKECTMNALRLTEKEYQYLFVDMIGFINN